MAASKGVKLAVYWVVWSVESKVWSLVERKVHRLAVRMDSLLVAHLVSCSVGCLALHLAANLGESSAEHLVLHWAVYLDERSAAQKVLRWAACWAYC